MAVSVSSLEGLIRGRLNALGFLLSGAHAQAGIAAKAVAVGVVGEINATAKVIVPPRAGGTYQVSGLSESGMSSKIRSSLSSQGISFGAHSMAHVLHESIAKAVTAEVLSKCTVSVPYDGSGSFQIVGLSQPALEAAIITGLQDGGVNTSNGDCGRFAKAVSQGVEVEINASAIIVGSFTGGGTFPVL